MEILFCDVCNESVPESDLRAGRAVRRNERVVCASCEAAMTAAAKAADGAAGGAASAGAPAKASPAPAEAAAAPRRGGGGVAAAVALVALLFSAGAAAWLARELETTRVDGEAERGDLRRDVRGLERGRRELVAALDRHAETLGARIDDAARATRSELSAELVALRRDVEQGLARVNDAERALSEVRAASEEAALGTSDRLDELTAQLLRAREDASFYGDRLAALEQALQSGRALAAAPAGGAPAGGAEPEGGAPAWQPLVADLQSDNAGIRWNAVDALGETGDPAVVPHLVAVLKDEDVFVRMAVARVLGDLSSPLGIEPLIDALEDSEAVVRETAMLSLRSITGRNFKFDAVASPAERAKKVKSWRKWWEKAKEEYFPASQP